ncbi:hypothetical protein MGYG_04983 [Nannizzia gypsea CBS 118893]|uniref:Uncharacterized protein n=1 Tax=Arthroderma gypseum (strain ATCC MYA-4604 / CBS 118893) TaxID=535722 RepID=E4UXY7_ARTGP|nr:hypothetical protein MGYG_04983 [Nannizzia gypsea CBS 118893]EFR01980.1 hypothetical protein MGYG_04983 [Nannizzia gypsea CBS 118893]
MAAQIFRRPATGALQLTRNSLVTAREFTSTCSRAEGDRPPKASSPRKPAASSDDFSSRRGAAVRRVQDVINRTSAPREGASKPTIRFTSDIEGSNSRPMRPSGPPARNNNRPGGPMLSMNADKLKERLRQRGGMGGSRGGMRLPRMATRQVKRKPVNRQQMEEMRRLAEEQSGADDAADMQEFMEFEREYQDKEKHQPAVRYNPQPYTAESLKETWPALAINGTSNTSTIREKLSWFGESYVGCDELPEDLAKRVYQGKRVFFSSETQKAETMKFVKQLASEHASKLSQRKGETVEPVDVQFENVSKKEKSDMISSLIRGAYDQPVKLDANASPILKNVLRNLSNNHTYHTEHTERFMGSLMQNLPLKKAKAKAKSA